MSRTLALTAILTLAAFSCLTLSRPLPALAAGDMNESACPFETETSAGFHSSLPDCRAFELVSPEYGGGALATGPYNAPPPISPDGNHLLAISLAAFAGTEELSQEGSEEFGAFYEFSRTPTGWIAEPQDPPATLYPFHHLQGVSPTDLGHSVWIVPDPLQPGQVREPFWEKLNNAQYVIREGKGTFSNVGPAVAPGHQVSFSQGESVITGVSNDLAHIVFRVRPGLKQFWPGDQTAALESLYEYHGTSGGEPVLVGVSNNGPPPWQAGATHRNEGAVLESDCGTTYDAISADGDRVVFTALHDSECPSSQPEANQLYARVDGTETVAISKPSTADCAACDTQGPQAPAVFAAASEDGSQVLFTTTQKLLNGAGGTSLYEYNFNAPTRNARLTLIAPDVTPVDAGEGFNGSNPPVWIQLSADGTRVYFSSTDSLTTNPNGNGERAVAGRSNLYTLDQAAPERLSFIATGETAAFGTSRLGATPSGRFIAFATTVHHGSDDTGSVPQIFEYDANRATLSRVSIGQRSPAGYQCETTGTVLEGYDCNGNTSIEEDTPRLVENSVDTVAEDGAVVFTSELPLTPGAIQGRRYHRPVGPLLGIAENVYEYLEGQVYLISPADEPTPAGYTDIVDGEGRLLGIDRSGANIFFATSDPLLRQDSDTQSSWYDAHQDGGFPPSVLPPSCAGETCQGPVATAPQLPVQGGSETAPAGANLGPPPPAAAIAPHPPTPKVAPKRCRKHFLRRKGRCVRAHASRNANRAGTAQGGRS